jgi:hypothetical protein
MSNLINAAAMQSLNTERVIKLYRYLPDEAAIKTIETRCFRVSCLSDLNDPFEWKFGIEGHPPQLETDLQQRMEGFAALAGQNMGILCFSKKINDPVLWSHYTNIHRGIAFEVDASVNANLVSDLHEVDYDKPRIVLPYRRMTDEELLGRMTNFFKQKSASWHYEQECRWIIGLESCVPKGGRHYWKIPTGFITRAFIGFRSSISFQYLRQALNLNGFQNVQILKCKPSLKSYDIELTDGGLM